MQKIKNKIIVVLGPTASGKTKLAVSLACKFNGEIVSADSRQVYRGMDVGTGKDLNEYKINGKKIKYHLIDIINPKTEFNLAKYQKLAIKAIDDVLKRGKLPILVGGTGLYIDSIVKGYQLSKAKPDKKLRASLGKKSLKELVVILKKIDSSKKLSLNDEKNKRRLIRYIEIAKEKEGIVKKSSKYNYLIFGVNCPREVLHKKIYRRLIERLEEENMIGEVKKLRKRGVSWKRLEGFGLEYKFISLYLRGKLDYEEMQEKLFIAIRQFAKRQMTWFKRDKNINWIKNKKEAEKKIKIFLK